MLEFVDSTLVLLDVVSIKLKEVPIKIHYYPFSVLYVSPVVQAKEIPSSDIVLDRSAFAQFPPPS